MLKNKFLFSVFCFLSILVLLIFLYLNSNTQNNSLKFPISISVSKTPLSAPFYVAQHIDAFNETCIDITMVEVKGGVAAFNHLIEKQTDFATSSNSVIAYQFLQQHNFVTHAVFAQSDNDVKFITRLNDNISTISALKGKKVGVVKASASEYFFSILLALEGLTNDAVQLVNYKPEQLPSALLNHEVDAIIPWEPFAYQVHGENTQVTIHDTKGLNALSFNLLSNKDTPQLLQKTQCLLQGLNTAIDYISANPTKAKNIVKKALNVSDDFIEWVWSDYIFKLSLNDAFVQDVKSQIHWIISSQHREKAQYNVIDAIDTRALKSIDPHAVNIQQ